ncbi:RNA polymerase II elongation factor [Bulinus truncatus]|nr:RNA polymerase II elongation factor [Bulinus truncatus]
MASVDIAGDVKTTERLVFYGDGVNETTNWKKGQKLGQGAFGKVFIAIIHNRDKELELAVKKIKIVEPQHLKETVSMEKMCHVNIVKCFGSHVNEGSFYIFMELMKEGSLEEFIKQTYAKKKTIDELYAGRIIQQVIKAVDYLHENNHFHRDIKSANILMSDEHNVKLADFGLTREFEEMTKSYTKGVGTSRFMAPEMVAVDDDGEALQYSNPVDIWAIGCIVVHMLTGALPFSNLTDSQVNSRLLQPDPSPARGSTLTFSDSCERFFKKTLAKDPKARATAHSLLKYNFVTGKKFFFFVGQQYQNCATNYTFEKEVNFNQDVRVDKVDTLNVKHLENLKADQIGKVEVQQASGSVSVGHAEAVKAQGNSVHFQRANTVETKDTKQSMSIKQTQSELISQKWLI